MAKKKVSFWSATWGSTENRVRKMLGLPPVSQQRHTLSSWAKTGIQRQALEWLGVDRGANLPKGFSADVFETLDRYVQAKGGYMQVGDGLKVPMLKLNRKSALSLASMWIAYVDFEHESANWKALEAAEETLEDALARECNQMLNIRILSKPARIEIDNPQPPMFRLSDEWKSYIDGTTPPERYLLGIESTAKEGDVRLNNRLSDSNEYSCAFLGASGSGKTQAITSALLTLCACTSPENLSVVVVDPKGLDLPLAGLPHLAYPVITNRNKAREAVLTGAEILKSRAEAQDRTASQKRILFVVDELGFLIQNDKSGEIVEALVQIAEMGRAWGVHLFLGSQRATNEFFPKSVLSQMPAKWTGRVKDAGESAFINGAGCDAHKLPGKGAAMLYEPNSVARIQSTYIGDANKDDYPEVIGGYVDDIGKRWASKQPHWRLGDEIVTSSNNDDAGNGGAPSTPLQAMIEDAVRKVLTEMATIQPADQEAAEQEQEPTNTAILDDLPDGVLSALEAAYNEAPDRFNKSRVRDAWQKVTGKRPKTEKEDKIFTAFLAYVEV